MIYLLIKKIKMQHICNKFCNNVMNLLQIYVMIKKKVPDMLEYVKIGKEEEQ